MRLRLICCVTLTLTVFLAGLPACGAEPAGTPPSNAQVADKPIDAAAEALVMFNFAPRWMPVPAAFRDSMGQGPTPVGGMHASVFRPATQEELNLSAEQRQTIADIKTKRMAEMTDRNDQMRRLPPAEQQKKVEEYQQWRKQFEEDVRKDIAAALTPKQFQGLKDSIFPDYVIGFLYGAKIRAEIGFGPEQEGQFRRLAKERLSRFQQEYMRRAERIWGLLSSEQQADLYEMIKQQPPRSAISTLSFELGFPNDESLVGYPMLAEVPVRERLGLSDKQQEQLRAILAEGGVRARKAFQEAYEREMKDAQEEQSGAARDVNAMKERDAKEREAREKDANERKLREAEDKKAIEGILTADQLATLREIDVRRQVVLTLGAQDRRKAAGISDQQAADLARIGKETSEQLYRVDREMLGRAMKLLTPDQREKLEKKIDQRGW
jgi:hypothetical protein